MKPLLHLSPTASRTCLALILIIALGCLHYAFPHLIGLDGYFHMRYSHLLRTQGLIHDLPWLSATLYAQNFVDDHFLFHVLQTPFTLTDPIWGAKLYGLVVATAAFLLFYHILTTHDVPYPALWTMALFVSSPLFVMRISMARAPGISLCLLLLAIYLLLRRRDYWIGPLAFVYVWTYGGFPLLWILVSCVFLTSLFVEKTNRWHLLLATGIGTVLGLVIHPYFPHNLQFLYISYSQIELGMSPDIIPMGAEDYPYAASTAVKHTLLVCAILFIALFIYLTRPISVTSQTLMLFLFSTVSPLRKVIYQ